MGCVHGGWQKYYSYTDRGIVEGFGETAVMSWVHGGWQKYYSYIDRGNW
jgi:hypothetical protein